MKKFFDNLNILNKILIVILIFYLIPLIIITSINYQITKNILIKDMLNTLEAINDHQADQIRSYIRNKELDVTMLARFPFITNSFETIFEAYEKYGLDSKNYKDAAFSLEKFLNYYIQEGHYQDVFLVAENGDVIFSIKQGEDLGSNYKTGIYRETELAKVYDRAITLLETQTSDFGYYPATNEPAIFIAAPIMKTEGILGAVVIQLSNEEVYRIITNYSGLQSTGETFLIGQTGDYISYLSPTRQDSYAAFKLKVPLHTSEGEFLEKVIRGNNIKGETVDYRGQEVLAVGQYFLPQLGWGMISKIDAKELFGPIKKMEWFAIFTILATAILAIFASRMIAHFLRESQSKELTSLKERLIEHEKLASLGSLAAGIAHEIKNPLNFVNNFSLISIDLINDIQRSITSRFELLSDEIKQFGLLKENICTIIDQGKKANSILQRMLGHSYLGKGTKALTDINMLLLEYLDLTYYYSASQEMEFDLIMDLDPSLEPISIISEDIGRVFLNILNNSIYAMHQKTQIDPDYYSPTLWLKTINADQWIEIRIRDNGPGMPEEISKNAFTPFFTSKPPGEGTGLGLSLSYNIIVLEHKGSIEFITKEHEYTEFIIRLPKSL